MEKSINYTHMANTRMVLDVIAKERPVTMNMVPHELATWVGGHIRRENGGHADFHAIIDGIYDGIVNDIFTMDNDDRIVRLGTQAQDYIQKIWNDEINNMMPVL